VKPRGERHTLPIRGSVELSGTCLTSYVVQEDMLSLHLRAEVPRRDVADILDRIADATRGRNGVPAWLGDIETMASIASVVSRRGSTSILVHAPKNRKVADQLFPNVGTAHRFRFRMGVPLPPGVAADEHHELAQLLERAAGGAGVAPEDLLERVTRFKRRDGKEIPGKRDLARVSPQQRRVVHDRLARMLDNGGTTTPPGGA
jgi:hypothetical protein